MNQISVLWIDDRTDTLRSAAQDAIRNPDHPSLSGKHARLDVRKVVTDRQIVDIIAELSEKQAQKQHLPDLVVIDQKLDVSSENDIVQRGSSIAAALRAQVHAVPLVGVTSGRLSDFSSLQKEQFVDVILRDSVHRQDRIPDLYAIAEGFSAIRRIVPAIQGRGSAINVLSKTFGAPPEEAGALTVCLPGEFKADWDVDTPHLLARWVWHTLLGRPGFVYDDLEVATMLGLSPIGFESLMPRFVMCQYSGAFSSPSRRRWWVSMVRIRARELSGEKANTPLWTAGRKIVGDTDRRLLSRCYGRRESKCIPDVVAYKDERLDPKGRVQALSDDTVLVESDVPPTGFEQRRVFSKR